MLDYDTEDIIYALATAPSKGAIAVIRVSGDGCVNAFSHCFRCRSGLGNVPSNSVVYGCVSDGERKLDDCVVTVYREGHGYTGEEALEVSCHGGLATVSSILALLSSIGFRQAQRGEFTLRAFLHGKMDLTRAEAVNELVNARGDRAMDCALDRLNGSLHRKVSAIKALVLEALSVIEVQLDYAEDEISDDTAFPADKLSKALSMAREVCATYRTGRLFSEGVKVVLAGAANAGKSSLFNMFLKEERAIVSPVAGTTRDYIEAQCVLDGIPVRLFDTAGLRESGCEIEEEGIRRSMALMEDADLVVYLLDASDPVPPSSELETDKRFIGVVNKTDVSSFTREGYLPLSVETGTGFEQLCSRIVTSASSAVPAEGDAVIGNIRQRQCLDRACDSLNAAIEANEVHLPLDMVAVDVQEAVEALGELTGEVTSDDILDSIFSSFCVGK